ncbi:hypothetical protein LGN04_28265, partial [Burkholderia multivorans]|nr:hypothetical protein [Burkholderia multivorans]
GLDTLDGLDDLTVRESRLLHAVELLNEKILLLTTSLFREDYPSALALGNWQRSRMNAIQ